MVRSFASLQTTFKLLYTANWYWNCVVAIITIVCLTLLEYPHPEEVDVRVFTAEGILLASTPFTYYDLNNSDLMLHILSQQLQSYFPAGTPGAGGMQVSVNWLMV